MARKVRIAAIRRSPLTLAVATALVPLAHGAQAQTAPTTLPTSGQVTAGSATISQPSAGKMQIDQASDKAVLQWQSFSIGSGAWVNFTQPSASSVALNRVVGNNPSEIFGRLTANGQVFLSNPNGVLFAPGASVDVGALFATTLSISDQDFLAGRYSFHNAGGAGSVVNQGVIIADGYAALAAPQVRNDGVIVARAGTVALAAGERVSLDMVGDGLIKVNVDQAALNASAVNSGRIEADGGRVVLTAHSANALLDTVVNNTGVVRATSLVERDGEIYLDGGSAGVVANSGTLQTAGDGKGGFVETSGARLEITSAPDVGPGGTWLIDPYNIRLVSGSTSSNSGAPDFTPTGDDSLIDVALVNAQLDAGTNVVIDTRVAGTQAGDITVEAAVAKTNVNGAGLTLNAAHDIAVSAGISLNAGSFAATAGNDMSVTSVVDAGSTSISAGGVLTLSAGGVQDAQIVSHGGQTVTAGGLVLHAQDQRNARLFNFDGDQMVTVGALGIDLSAAGGEGRAQIRNETGSGAQTVSTSGDLDVAGGGSATLGPAGWISGVFQNATGTQSVSAASIALRGSDAGFNGGAQIVDSVIGGAQQVNASGAIDITSGGSGQGNRAGIVGNGTQTITGGAITLTGGAGGTGTAANNTSNGAFISIGASGGLQTIDAGSLTLNAGAGGQDTFAAVVAPTQVISIAGDVSLNGGGAIGGGNGARIGGAGGAGTSTNLTLSAANVTLTGGSVSGAGLGSAPGSGQANNVAVDATGDVRLISNSGGGVRIGYGPSDPSPGHIFVRADGDIALSGTGRGAVIRSTEDVTLSAGGAITQTGNTTIVAGVLTTASGASTSLGGFNQISSYGGSSGADFLLNNFGALSVSGIGAAGSLALFNAGTLSMTADGADAIVSSATGQTISAASISLIGQNGGRAILFNAAGDQQVTATAGGIDLIGVNGTGLAKIANGFPEVSGVAGSQTVSASGALNVVGGAVGVGPRLTNSGVFENTTGKQTVSAASISLQGANAAVTGGGAFIRNTIGGGDQEINVASGTISVRAGSIGLANRAGITSNGDQTINGDADIFLAGGASGAGTNPTGTSNSVNLSTAADKTQTIRARNITVSAGSGGVDSYAVISGGAQDIVTTGDVHLNGSDGNTGTFTGARIGGPGSAATQLALSVHDVVLSGGAASGAVIGGNSVSGAPTEIALTASGDVVINAGARIGSALGGAGNLSISAAGNIALEGTAAHSAAIRTTGSVTLDAGQAISESGNAFVASPRLAVHAGTSAALAGENQVASFTATSGSDMVFNNVGDLSVIGISAGGTLSLTNAGVLGLSASGGSDALIVSVGGQTLNAERLVVHAQDDSLARIINSGGNQTVNVGPGGIDLTVAPDGRGAAQIVNGRGIIGDGTQNVSTSGLLNVVGGSTSDFRGTNSGVFQSQTGKQTVSAGSIELQAAIAPVTLGGAMITSFDGGASSDQRIDVATGAIRLTGGGIGFDNRALISAGGNQTIAGNADIVLTGGSSGTGTNGAGNNTALISASGLGKKQTISAGGITLNAGPGGTDTFAVIVAGEQHIDVSGDVTLNGSNGNTGSGNGARIGGGGGRATNLTLSARNVTLNDGLTSGVALGSSPNGAARPNNISVNATGDVTLNALHGVGVRIGGTPVNGVVGGDISVHADGNIALNGFAGQAGVRTTENVTLDAGQSITQTGNAAIVAGTLSTNSGASTLLGGANQVLAFNAVSGGDVLLDNTGVLNVTGLSAVGNASLDNAGDVTISGLWSAGGATSITVHSDLVLQNALTASSVVLDAGGGAIREEAGGWIGAGSLVTFSAGSTLLDGANQLASFSGSSGGSLSLTNVGDLTIGSPVYSGALGMNILGALDVRSIVSSTGGQAIHAQGLDVTADGGTAELSNFGGEQLITVSGGSVDVRSVGIGGSASIENSGGGQQSVVLLDGDHIGVDGAAGLALVQSGGNQVLSATGNGANAVRIGSGGALGPTIVVAIGSQNVTAGAAGETGSISIVGAAGQNSLTGFLTNPTPGATQTISTAGEITIQGGSAAAQNFNTPAGIFHNGSGQQTINAAGISLAGGDAGNTNAALINALGGGVPANGANQVFNVGASGIRIAAGSVGSGNRAGIFGSATQTFNVDGDITITGGGDGSGFASNNTSNNAFISNSGASAVQTINARNITINAGAGGSDTFAVIVGAHQAINATEDVVLNGGGGFGTSNGARIGGRGGQSTDVVLSARNVVLNGGATTGAGLGSTGTGTPQPNSVAVHASGDVVLNAGPGAGVRIGSGANGLAGGNIAVDAGGNIALNGDSGQAATIRTTDSVTLDAGQTISESGNAFISAGNLTAHSGTSMTLGGANEVASFTGTSGGDMVFNNVGDLAVVGISAGGTLSLTDAGELGLSAIAGSDALISSFGGQTISADRLAVHAQDDSLARIINNGGNQSVNVGAGGIDLTVLDGRGAAQIVNAKGIVTDGEQTVSTSGLLNALGGSTSDFRGTNSGVFQNQAGKQTVSASGIDLRAAIAAVARGGAMITSIDGGPSSDQEIDVASGVIRLMGGGIGFNNRAIISAGGNQTIGGNADIEVTGGSSGTGTNAAGTSNAAIISATTPGKQQTISARSITLNAGPGGTDTFAVLVGAEQHIGVSGDVTLNGSDGNTGSANGARIGGTSGPTNLTLSAHDVTLNDGATSGVALGASPNGAAQRNNISVNATGDVTLNASKGVGVRIGGTPANGVVGGDISIRADGNITLNGVAGQAGLRTTDNVTMQAGGTISEGPSGAITAGFLAVSSSGAALTGSNHVSAFAASMPIGDVTLVNSGALDVQMMDASSATVVNDGSLTLSGPWNSWGATSIAATGDLTVTSNVFAGDTSVNVGGALRLDAADTHDATFTSFGSQTISAGSLAVTARDGRYASLAQFGPGDQAMTVTGGSIDVQTLDGGGFASISAGGTQTIALLDGDHFAVDGAGGGAANVGAYEGSQTISLTGSGRNAMAIGSLGALGSSSVGGRSQTIVAGADGQSGSIDISGGAQSGALAFLSTAQAAEGTQTISTSGTIRITGGDVPSQGSFGTASGIYHNGSDVQTINAAGIELQGGSSGVNNGAIIISSGGAGAIAAGDQAVNVVGGIDVRGGSAGSGNSAGIFAASNQTIAAASISLRGADGGSRGTASIGASGGREQVIDVSGEISITGGSNGLSNRAGISTTGNQTIIGNPDIVLTGGSSGAGTTADGTSNGVFIAANAPGRQQTIQARSISLSAGPGGTDTFAVIAGGTQVIGVSGDVRLNGSDGNTGSANGARIGGAGSGPTHLALSADNVYVSGGATSGAGIGGSPTSTATSDIAITAVHDVVLEGGTGGAARIGGSPATGTVTVAAGGEIGESGNAFINAASLTTSSGGSTLLGGPNQIAMFNATSGGDVLLNNTGVLDVTGLSAVGNATLDNWGDVTISGPWTAGGTTSITVHSDLFLQGALMSQNVVLAALSGSIQENGMGSIDAESLTTSSVGDTTLDGANTVSTFSASSDTGGVLLNNAGPLEVTSISAPHGFELSNEGDVTLPATVDIPLTLAAHGDLNLTRSLRAPDLTLRSDTGNITVGGAHATGATVLYASDSLTVTAPGEVLVRGSDCTAGAGSYLLAGGLLDIRAGSFSLVGGAAPFAPAAAAGNAVNVSTAGDLTLTGGRGVYSPALLFSGSNINLTVGGRLKIDGGSGEGSFARIQTATSDGQIHITFTNESGDYVVDGLDGRSKHGLDGFYTGVQPARVGDTLFVDSE